MSKSAVKQGFYRALARRLVQSTAHGAALNGSPMLPALPISGCGINSSSRSCLCSSSQHLLLPWVLLPVFSLVASTFRPSISKRLLLSFQNKQERKIHCLPVVVAVWWSRYSSGHSCSKQLVFVKLMCNTFSCTADLRVKNLTCV